MALFIGIVGLPNVGKSTLFNALTAGDAEASNYPFCTVEPNVGVVPVPDQRLQALGAALAPESVTPTAIRFVDIAGLVRGASQGEGLGNQFLAHVREADALLHVVRCFGGGDVAHVDGDVDPVRDVTTIETELMLADLAAVERALPRLDKVVRTDPRAPERTEFDVLTRVLGALEQGQPVRSLGLSAAETEAVAGHQLLTLKPVLYLANVAEDEAAGQGEPVAALAAAVGAAQVVPVAAQIEAELGQLDPEERAEFLTELGLEAGGIERVIAACYALLGLVTFYTTAHGKLQAWQLPAGCTAPAAAGRIHSDMESGFIRAEVAAAADVLAAGGLAPLRDCGKLRTEGRDYVIADGDVVNFLFKV